MAAIGPKDTAPELLVRRLLHASGFRFRLHRRDLPGRPDIVLPRYRTVVMVHGCFWHHHGCKNSGWPKTRTEFWRAKIIGNQDRDRRNVRDLTALGWRVVIIWECQTRASVALARLVRRLRARRV
jgi:DNA mismatch endonuclease (patch repair protein)